MYKSFLIFFFFGLCNRYAAAQSLNITGDTVYVNAEAEFVIYFPTIPVRFSTLPADAPYSLKSIGTGVNISAKAENTKPATLLVSEAGRNHRFIITFKKNIDYNTELIYDYNTEKKLQQHLAETALRKSQAPPKQAAHVEAVEAADKKLADNEKLARQLNDKYLAITDEGRLYLDQRKYSLAKNAYKQAIDLKPGDLYASHQIEIINKILLDENNKKEQEKSKDLYKEYISQGEKAYNNNQLTEARIAFEQALLIKPADALASSRLSTIDKKEKLQHQKDELESNYNTSIQLADKFFQAGDYDGAKSEYTKALGFFKRQWPQDQLKEINKKLSEQAAKEGADRLQQEKRLITERQEKEKQALENNYNAAVQSADDFFKQENYLNAKIEYNKALDFIRKDWPRDQIERINKILADKAALENKEKQERQQQELENKYSGAMQSADKLFNAGDYEKAKAEYNRAMSIIPRPLPQEQIKKINGIIAKQIEEANAAKLRQAQETEITARFNTLIKNADMEFDKSNYIKAKKIYSDAANLKPAETYPKERLTDIDNIFAKIAADLKAKNDSIALARENSRKYNLAISMAKSKYQKNDLAGAKTFYEEAADLRPSEEEPKGQLQVIDNKLADIARENEINGRYELKTAFADSLLNTREYSAALIAYNESLTIKPTESYPKSQIKYVQSEITAEEKRKVINRKREDEIIYRDALKSAEKAVTDKRYRDAKSSYIEALAIHPENKYAQDRLKIVLNQVQIMRTEKRSHLPVVKAEEPVVIKEKKTKKDKRKSKTDNQVLQALTPYTREELKNKYPTIDFALFPKEQPFNRSVVYLKEDLHNYDTILSEKPRLSLSSTDQEVKLVCEGIDFGETTVFIKFHILNKGTADFLTGEMMLSWTRAAGNVIKLYPYYLYPSSLPVIRPGGEAVVIYVCKSYDMSDEESLSFQLSDRFNKIKAEVKIPGLVYNQEWAR